MIEETIEEMTEEIARYKRQAARAAVELVEPGMVVGLGSGSTAAVAVELLATRLRTGELHDVVGVPCSLATARLAAELGVPATVLEQHPVIDLTIDGADEVSETLDLIKGGGGALLREKIVAQASRREVIVVDDSKLSTVLGQHRRLPVEVVPFGWGSQARFLNGLGAQVKLRRGQRDEPYVTDQGNWILDCDFGAIEDPAGLAQKLKARTGIVEHGLFVQMAGLVIAAGASGVQRLIPRERGQGR